ncbi:alpha/beta hydrolase [Pseudoclavibacter sp. AY1F1]|uniref:alpha/beta hydrolase n=1 Tax=Pseudoclavibacter sp. AY1F1 TaxID=2080583 RepID=UPI0015E32485|nr:alpha/beta hydrolase-fold protein [Pseudoclavibacter sp. AY1F1]
MSTASTGIDPTTLLWRGGDAETAATSEVPLVVGLHGYGADGTDIFSLTGNLPQAFRYVSVPAPHGQAEGGREWFPLRFSDPATGEVAIDADAQQGLEHGANEAASAVLELLDGLGVFTSGAPVVLLGYSQGGIVAMQALRQRPGAFTGALLLSGLVAVGTVPGDAELALTRPPVFWGRGDADTVIPSLAVEHTAAWLEAHVDAEIYVEAGLGHAVSEQELPRLVTYLERVLG